MSMCFEFNEPSYGVVYVKFKVTGNPSDEDHK